jgi:diaminohydroxyphosphoribosylaminopyrimidine deaminase/5-amino-6-(5-phosphoribosylamino)uracil reductase
MVTNDDILFMKRALRLAGKGAGFVNPNPQVGAVIVKNGRIIGEGAHETYGEAHAEINAINNSSTAIKNSTLYVTLEPCNHQGKTPPCTERIIQEGFRRVVVGMSDPNKRVNGQGINQLREAGIEVEVLEENIFPEIHRLNEVYTRYVTSGLPFCAMKSAMTLDGKISTFTGDSKWITNEKSRAFTHELRHRYAAIMVGVNTIIQDNPQLTDRSSKIPKKNPVRIVVDSIGRTPIKSEVLNTRVAKTIVAVTKLASKSFVKNIKDMGVDVIVCPENESRVDLSYLIQKIGEMKLDSILLEGGSTLNFSAFREGIVDKVYAFISPKLVGGKNALTPVGGAGFEKIADAITLNIHAVKRFDEDIMVEAYITKK